MNKKDAEKFNRELERNYLVSVLGLKPKIAETYVNAVPVIKEED